MAGKNGGARPGAGRKRTAIKHQTAREKAEGQIVDRLPWIIEKLFELGEGVAVEKFNSMGVPMVYQLPPDLGALKYLADRVMGKPTERQEVSGPDGGPIDITSTEREQAAKELNEWREQMNKQLSGLNAPLMPPTPVTTTES